MPGHAVERQYPEVFRALKQARREPRALRSSTDWDFGQDPTTASTLTELARYQAVRPIAIRSDLPTRFAIVAHESFTTDGTGSNQETFNLTYDIVNNPDATEPFVLYEGATAASADSVDYSANTFDYTDDGTANTLHAYYLVADAGEVRVRKVSPGGNVHEDLLITNTATVNVRDQNDTPLQFDLDESKLQRVLARDWTLRVLVDAPFVVQRDDATDAGAIATNLMLQVPYYQAQERIDGLGKALTADVNARVA